VIKRAAVIFVWLVLGHAVIGGLYWTLLVVPESNVTMLGTSLVLVIGIVWSLGFVEGTALLSWQAADRMRRNLAPAARRAWLIVLPLIVFALVWWMTGLVSGWLDRHWSEIDAWILLKTGWTRAAILRSAFEHVIAFVRVGVGASLALALFAGLLRRGLRGLLSASWLQLAFSWRVLVVVAAALVVGVLLPSHLAYWRWQPKSLSATWFEPAFAAAKLSLMFLLSNLAWAAVVRTVARESLAVEAPPPTS